MHNLWKLFSRTDSFAWPKQLKKDMRFGTYKDHVSSSELGTEPEYKDSYSIVWKCGKIQILGDDTNNSEWYL
jgi:hypothetical protein